MNIRNTALTQKIESVRDAIEQAESIDIGGSKPQLEQALSSQIHLRDVIDSLIAVREETDRNISAIRRVLELLDEPATTASGSLYETTMLADKPVWQQAEAAIRQEGRFMAVGEVVDGIVSLGGDPGKAPSAAVNNGLRRHDDVFVIKKEGARNYFGLREWGERSDMKSMFED